MTFEILLNPGHSVIPPAEAVCGSEDGTVCRLDSAFIQQITGRKLLSLRTPCPLPHVTNSLMASWQSTHRLPGTECFQPQELPDTRKQQGWPLVCWSVAARGSWPAVCLLSQEEDLGAFGMEAAVSSMALQDLLLWEALWLFCSICSVKPFDCCKWFYLLAVLEPWTSNTCLQTSFLLCFAREQSCFSRVAGKNLFASGYITSKLRYI